MERGCHHLIRCRLKFGTIAIGLPRRVLIPFTRPLSAPSLGGHAHTVFFKIADTLSRSLLKSLLGRTKPGRGCTQQQNAAAAERLADWHHWPPASTSPSPPPRRQDRSRCRCTAAPTRPECARPHRPPSCSRAGCCPGRARRNLAKSTLNLIARTHTHAHTHTRTHAHTHAYMITHT